ncbi:MAG: hypothetical protein ABR531_06640 [Bacteroidales bacterium]
MTDDSDFPRLTPPDDRYPAPDGLLRRPEELTDEQFDLLAAAWSEEALAGDRPSVLEETLAGDQLSELEEAMTAIPSRRLRAESFRGVKLVPYDDKWDGRNRLLRQAPATRVIKRTLVVTLLAAAAVVAFIITGPAIRSRTPDIMPETLPEGTVMSEALISEAFPVIIPERSYAEPAAVPRMADPGKAVPEGSMIEPEREALAPEPAGPQRALPVNLAINVVNPVMIAAARTTDLKAMQMTAVIPTPAQDKADNWIIRGISLLAKTVTKEEKKIDGYLIASACVKGLNNALGWEMELEQASNKAGEPVAVNFSSSLLSFSAPVNKNSP